MANVKLILLDDVESLGMAGDEVTVSPGYARNYLIPKQKAIPVSAAAARVFEARKAKIEEKRKQAVAESQSLAERIAGTEVIIAMETIADDQTLYGSVTVRSIADALHAKGLEIAHNRVLLAEPIKHIGEYPVQVKLAQNIVATVTVQVTKA